MVDLRDCKWETVEVEAGAVIFGFGPRIYRQKVQWIAPASAEIHWDSRTATIETITGYLN
jgi:hypothetical protein